MSKTHSSKTIQSASPSPVSPGTLYLVHDDRSRQEVRFTLWQKSARGSIALGQIIPGDTMMIINTRYESKETKTKMWDILSKGKIGYIYVDSDIMINFRRISWIDE